MTMRTLTAEQQQAVERRRGSLLLSAAAGSGKTSVLVERYARAVCEDGIPPARILAITFTERAAAELCERIRARLREMDEREAARDIEGAPVGTFHGFCARLLRSHALTASLDPEFAILDEVEAGRLRTLAFRRALAELLASEHREAAIELLAAYGADRVRGMVLGVYAEQRSRGVGQPVLPDPSLSLPAARTADSPAQPTLFELEQPPSKRRPPDGFPAERLADDPDLPDRKAPDREAPDSESTDRESTDRAREQEATRACALLGELLERFGRGYAALKRARAALDFDDLELRARDLLERHEGVRRGWSERIELMMVDEFQDTNRRQLALLELLERDNLFTVGDELQSIYGFRHAEVEIFRERRRALASEGAALTLTHNFRGRPPLIAAVNNVFAERFGDAHTPLVAMREHSPREEPPVELLLTDRNGWAQSPDAGAIAGALPPAPLWRHAEARLLAQRVAELVVEERLPAGDITVLLRAASDLPVYERALQDRGLRTLAAVGSFWVHQQINDLLAWLRALANPLDELALYSALASPLVGISSDGLALLALHARAAGVGVWDATVQVVRAKVMSAAGSELGGGAREDGGGGVEDDASAAPLGCADHERLARFAEYFPDERRLAPILGPAELLLRAIARNGYERQVLALAAGERRLANIHKLLRLARRHEAAEGRDLRSFLDHVELRRTYAEGSEPHAPIGSEPDAVRLMTIHAAKGLEFPVACIADLGRSVNGAHPDLLVDGERIGLRLASIDGSPAVACLRYHELSEERRRAEAAEEERILYVAMTRARERLLLSGACDFARWSAAAPIGWLAPALAPELPALARSLEQPVAELPIAEGLNARVRCWLNSHATVGSVLRMESPPAAMLVQ